MKNYNVEKDWISNSGHRCVVIMTSLGHRCGYVGISKHNRLFGIDYSEAGDFYVHGGLTYSGDGKGLYPVESDLWWLGYDCAHYGDGKDLSVVEDIIKEHESKYPTHGVLRSLEYCINECESLSEQIKYFEN